MTKSKSSVTDGYKRKRPFRRRYASETNISRKVDRIQQKLRESLTRIAALEEQIKLLLLGRKP